ncbi:MAG: CRISPR-associated endonuclease Cas2 [Acidobacteria bacterium]|nr:CRISPR-associated endonuclease Cas2 [Acidobacteriota bacterium]MBI3657498.1 CRISPR-associated endonuclease Cas2 [Acidobacteriota bacterium]
MRTRYIVSYDISDPHRLRRVHRTMRGYGDALQYSVFRCDLSPAERVLLIEALTQIINHREDQIMLINIGPSEGRGQESIETLGRAIENESSERIALIV